MDFPDAKPLPARPARGRFAAVADGLPRCAVPLPFEIEQGVLATSVPGHRTEVSRVGDVTIFRRDFGATRP